MNINILYRNRKSMLYQNIQLNVDRGNVNKAAFFGTINKE